MFGIETKRAYKTSGSSGNNTPPYSNIQAQEGTLDTIKFLDWLDPRSILAFSVTCRAATRMSSSAMKEILLTATVRGDEDFARKILKFHPELLLDYSTIVTDLSGKQIENLTPLQAAICAWDVDMVHMMQDVLQHRLQSGLKLSFEPEAEIQRQFAEIYPDGIDSVVADQQAKAQEFKTQVSASVFNLNRMFDEINAATDAEVQAEITNPGQHTDSNLNAALHSFRSQFAARAKQERIFNPYYLLAAFEFYEEQYSNFRYNDLPELMYDRRDLFWRQVIGYIQRYLPACYLQEFAQGIYYIAVGNEKLRRSFEFRDEKGRYMLPADDFNSLGYKWVVSSGLGLVDFQKFPQTKKSGLENLCAGRAKVACRPVA